MPDTDTGSEFSAGFNEVIGDLHSLRRSGRGDGEEDDDDDQSTTVTETSSLDEREGVVNGRRNVEGTEIRQRKDKV